MHVSALPSSQLEPGSRGAALQSSEAAVATAPDAAPSGLLLLSLPPKAAQWLSSLSASQHTELTASEWQDRPSRMACPSLVASWRPSVSVSRALRAGEKTLMGAIVGW